MTAILEGGGADGCEGSVEPGLGDGMLRIKVASGQRETYYLLTDDDGQPMRDMLGRYRYRVQW